MDTAESIDARVCREIPPPTPNCGAFPAPKTPDRAQVRCGTAVVGNSVELRASDLGARTTTDQPSAASPSAVSIKARTSFRSTGSSTCPASRAESAPQLVAASCKGTAGRTRSPAAGIGRSAASRSSRSRAAITSAARNRGAAGRLPRVPDRDRRSLRPLRVAERRSRLGERWFTRSERAPAPRRGSCHTHTVQGSASRPAARSTRTISADRPSSSTSQFSLRNGSTRDGR